MKQPDHLFELIKSLSISEKRYFKLLSGKHVVGDENNYIKIFNAVDAHVSKNRYDEKAIISKFAQEKFIKHFAFHKNYLYNLLLDSLHVYHMNLGTDARLQKQLHQAAVLFQKGLFKQCKTLLDKTKREALEMERYQYLFEAIVIEKKLIKGTSFANVTEAELLQLHLEGKLALSQTKNVDEYLDLQDHLIYLFNKSGEVRSKHQKKKYDSIMRNPLLKSEKKALSLTGKRIFNNIHTIYSFSAGNNFQTAFKYVSRCLELLEAAPAIIKEDPNVYIAILTNFLSTCSQYNHFVHTEKAIEKMRSIAGTYKLKLSSSLQMKIFTNSALFELNMYAGRGEFEKINSLIGSIETDLTIFNGKINPAAERTLQYNIACMYFGARNYKKTIEWLNKILKVGEADTKQDIVCFSKILQFMTHLELDNTDFLSYIVKSTENFLDKRNRIHKGETIVLNFVKKFQRIDSQKELMDLYSRTRMAFVKIENLPLEKNFFRYFDFLSWVNSKIERKTFMELVKNKYKESLKKQENN